MLIPQHWTITPPEWHDNLIAYLSGRETLVARYAKEREQNRIPVEITPDKEITLNPPASITS